MLSLQQCCERTLLPYVDQDLRPTTYQASPALTIASLSHHKCLAHPINELVLALNTLCFDVRVHPKNLSIIVEKTIPAPLTNQELSLLERLPAFNLILNDPDMDLAAMQKVIDRFPRLSGFGNLESQVAFEQYSTLFSEKVKMRAVNAGIVTKLTFFQDLFYVRITNCEVKKVELPKALRVTLRGNVEELVAPNAEQISLMGCRKLNALSLGREKSVNVAFCPALKKATLNAKIVYASLSGLEELDVPFATKVDIRRTHLRRFKASVSLSELISS